MLLTGVGIGDKISTTKEGKPGAIQKSDNI